MSKTMLRLGADRGKNQKKVFFTKRTQIFRGRRSATIQRFRELTQTDTVFEARKKPSKIVEKHSIFIEKRMEIHEIGRESAAFGNPGSIPRAY
jgi:hypothetical protein